MIREEQERLADRLALGHAGPEEEAEILARAAEDPKLARLIQADRAIVAGISMDKASLPAGAVEPGAGLLAALKASPAGVSGGIGGSLALKGIVGGLAALGLATGLSLLPGTGVPPPAPPAATTQSAPQDVSAPSSIEPKPASTLGGPASTPPRALQRTAARRVEPRVAKSAPNQKPPQIGKEHNDGNSARDRWKGSGKRGTKTNSSTETDTKIVN